jgi:16S rRNA (cytosine967-C5)-methyltransferase
MTKRRSSVPTKAAARSPRRRRVTSPRTPQDNVRVAAAWALEQTLASRAPVDSFLASALTRLDERDHGLLRELVLGTLRWLRRLDHVIASASYRRTEEIEAALWNPLRIGAYQLLFLSRVPAHAAVDEAVKQAGYLTHRGGASFVNAVLRRIARAPSLNAWPVKEEDPVARLAIEMSHPDFLVYRWWHRFGAERTRALLASNNRAKPLHLLAFRDRGGRELLAESLIDDGLEVEPSSLLPLALKVRRGSPMATAAFRRGDLYIQDEASQAAALIPFPELGERILDAAAAPGGKAFALLAWEPGVDLTLADVAPERVLTLRDNLRRLRRELPVVLADAGEPATRGGFGRVVLDVPCTGTGTLRKHPELKWRISEGEIGRLKDQALRMIRGAAPLVAPGGLLALISCSLEDAENEELVEQFLDEGQGRVFGLLPLEDRLPSSLTRGIQGPGFWRLLPADDHDGFTVHVLIRRDA